MTTLDFAGVDPDRWIALVPVGATEQHGPHLPVSVDCTLNSGVVEAALAMTPDDVLVTVLPMLPIGKSNEHINFPGTLTVSAETLIRMWTEVGESVHRAGFRKIVFFNSHGGQPQIVDVVVRDLRVRLGMVAISASWWGLGMRDGLFSDQEVKYGIHAGEIETSMMLHVRPDLVRHNLAQDFRSRGAEFEADYAVLRAEGGIGMGWASEDLHESGAMGNAAAADAARGKILVEDAAARLVALLRDVTRFPLSRIATRSQGAATP
jgi:creatinine amidohydrolase